MNTLFSLLVCPSCKSKLQRVRNTTLKCTWCNARYAIKDGIPVLIDLTTISPHLAQQIRTFKAEAKHYVHTYYIEPWQKKYIHFLISNLRTCKGKTAFDNGCGGGYMAIELAKRGSKVIASDLNMTALIRLRTIIKDLALDNLILPICCSSEHLPIKNNSIDAINANSILEHLPDEASAIRDMTAIAKKGAVATITVPVAYRYVNPIVLPLNLFQDHRMGHLRRYTKITLMDKFINWYLLHVYHIGHTMKVIKTLINQVKPIFDWEALEKEDEPYFNKPFFSTNISVVIKKK